MATITLGKVRVQVRGEYSSGTTYYPDDVVFYAGAMYISTYKGSHSGNTPIGLDDESFRDISRHSQYGLDDKFWARFGPEVQLNEFRGEWSSGTMYYPGDIVTRTCGPDGEWVHSYYCLQLCGGELNDPFWNYFGTWEVFVEGGGSRHHRRIVRLGTEQPIGWRGHPKPTITMPNWGGSNSWQGNIPWNVGAGNEYEEWNPSKSQGSIGVGDPSGALCGIMWDGTGVTWGGRYYGTAGDYTTDTTGAIIYPHEKAFHHTDYYDAVWQANPAYSGGISHWKKGYTEDLDQFLSTTRLRGLPEEDYGYDQFRKQRANALRDVHLNSVHNRGVPRAVSCFPAYGGGFLFDNGTLQIFGSNGASGWGTDHTSHYLAGSYLGNGAFAGRRIVKVVSGGVDNGSFTVMALDEEGEIWTWGENSGRECGIGPEAGVSGRSNLGLGYDDNTDVRQPIHHPKELDFESNRIVDIFMGGNPGGVCAALDEDGQLWTWGDGTDGALGYATNSGFTTASYCAVPKKINVNWNTYGGIQKIVIGGDNSACNLWVLDGQGYIWNCGYNSQGILGTGNTTSTGNAGSIARRVWSGLSGSIINFWVTGYGSYGNAWFLKSDGTLYGTGDNSEYQLETGNTTDQTTPVALDTGRYGDIVKVVFSTDDDNNAPGNIYFLDENLEIFGNGQGVYYGLGHGFTNDTGSNNNRSQLTGQDRYEAKHVPVPRGVWAMGVYDVETNGAYWGIGGGNYRTHPCVILGGDGSICTTGSHATNTMSTTPSTCYSNGFADHWYYGT